MSSTKDNYEKLVMEKMPKSKKISNCIKAFFVGGFICTLGELICFICMNKFGIDKEVTASIQSIVLIFLGATLTGIGVYDKIGNFAGAGSVVPITGFANSIVSPAMEFKREGIVMGIGAKLFILAGPVLVNGISASVIIGIIYFFIGR